MYTILLVVHVLVAIGLIGLILIQHGKGADAGAAFGSGASSTVFGARGSSSFLTRTTSVLATAFFLLSLALAYLTTAQVEDKTLAEPVPVEVAPKADEGGEDVPAIPGEPATPPAAQPDVPPIPE